ncbi:MAG TPA: hypothetical protein VNA65_00330 [Candidatus Dormibacteraeota bacterium]|nr:hypothetical protein [Candidatus Dormibacteraeota bacterium]
MPDFANYQREQVLDHGVAERLIYNETFEFCDWLVEVVAEGDEAWIQPFANVLEDLLTDGDAETKEIAVIGLIEDIQHLCVDRKVDPDRFLAALGPAAREAWWKMVRFWYAEHPERWPGSFHD